MGWFGICFHDYKLTHKGTCPGVNYNRDGSKRSDCLVMNKIYQCNSCGKQYGEQTNGVLIQEYDVDLLLDSGIMKEVNATN